MMDLETTIKAGQLVSLKNNADILHSEFEEYSHYIKFGEGQLKSTAAEIGNMSREEQEEMPILADASAFAYRFPQLFRDSTFLSLFALVESKLNEVCDLYASIFRSPLTFKDIEGKGIHRARKYISKVIGMPLQDTQHWQQLMLYQKLRNCKTHSRGRIDAGFRKQFSRSIQGIEFSADNFVFPTESFLPAFIEIVDPYMARITWHVADFMLNKLTDLKGPAPDSTPPGLAPN